MKNLNNFNVKKLDINELENLNGGSWIYDLFKIFGKGSVKEYKHSGGNVGSIKYGGAWHG